jgi:hypothetical protein
MNNILNSSKKHSAFFKDSPVVGQTAKGPSFLVLPPPQWKYAIAEDVSRVP